MDFDDFYIDVCAICHSEKDCSHSPITAIPVCSDCIARSRLIFNPVVCADCGVTFERAGGRRIPDDLGLIEREVCVECWLAFVRKYEARYGFDDFYDKIQQIKRNSEDMF